MRKNLLGALLFLAVFATAGTLAFAVPERPGARPARARRIISGDWTIYCAPIEAALPCRAQSIAQGLVQSGKTVASLALAYSDNHQLAMEIFFPFASPQAVALQPGVKLLLDSGVPRPYPYRSCNNIGCFAQVVMDDDFAKAFVAAGSIQIQATDLHGAQFSLPVSMKGFEAAKLALDRT